MVTSSNPTRRRSRAALLAAGLGVVSLVPALVTVTPAFAETAVAPERHPPGDIPDSQAFITYRNAAGYALKVPEGWARSEAGADVRFQSKLDGVAVAVTDLKGALSTDWVKAVYAPMVEQTGRAVKIDKITRTHLPAGTAILLAYSYNSDPSPVTNKQIRMEAHRYLLAKGGKLLAIDLSAPFGADNVDQWRLMSRSLRWQ